MPFKDTNIFDIFFQKEVIIMITEVTILLDLTIKFTSSEVPSFDLKFLN